MLLDISFQEKVNYFMYPFMAELEIELQKKENELITIPFHDEEANTDSTLKVFMKDFIQESFNALPNTLHKKFHFHYLDGITSSIIFDYTFFHSIYIKKVYLPKEITESIKDLFIRKEGSIYKNPDILLEVTDGYELTYIPIELKSTKTDTIPGSSVQQITPNEWVIFVKHTDKNVTVSTGQYIYTINSNIPFPDRSPRPLVAFNALKEWNEIFRQNNDKYLTVNISEIILEERTQLIEDWQNVLAKKWLEVLLQNSIKKQEPWFNNNLRKFILQFLEFYEKLSPEEKVSFQKIVKGVIK